ncbi:hypothetical protein M0220_12535 [Halomonas qinghailakensis]|uniref:Phage abortive infection protein n=1 Tax=Halomonas qinghailakensis TaxID=2937790 RepID=A0AA46YN74_9GAMM|nr:hypothetical protein [Halomonas sp. ZZQ-149]UYO73701.1 hypothetical protein M0220_12535 [Halomonas sp. ZZQ-149]
MKPKFFVIIAFLVLALGWFSYWMNFGFIHKLEISSSQEHWALFGDFLGGVVNPILTFLTILILVRSLSLHKEEVGKVNKHEKVRSFETHFFNMIASQKTLYDNFVLEVGFDVKEEYNSANAVIALEDIILEIKSNGGSKEDIAHALNEYDSEDRIYSVVRTFSVIVKLVEKKLSDSCGFDKDERSEYYEVLINYTDFSLVRLILISIKYTEYAQTNCLRNNKEFMGVFETLGISDYLKNI